MCRILNLNTHIFHLYAVSPSVVLSALCTAQTGAVFNVFTFYFIVSSPPVVVSCTAVVGCRLFGCPLALLRTGNKVLLVTMSNMWHQASWMFSCVTHWVELLRRSSRKYLVQSCNVCACIIPDHLLLLLLLQVSGGRCQTNLIQSLRKLYYFVQRAFLFIFLTCCKESGRSCQCAHAAKIFYFHSPLS